MSDNVILLAGAGPMAVAHAQVLKALNQPFFCVGRGAERAARFEVETGAPAVAGGVEAWSRQAERPDVAAAVVAVSLVDLGNVTQKLLRAGIKRILVEKPAALTLSEIEALDKTAQQVGASVYVAYNRRFYAATNAARQMIEEDGGVSSFFFDFTEIASRTVVPGRGQDILHNWFLANSSHVVDLAFHLGGRPRLIDSRVKGTLDWHPAGATFAGSGETESNALFSYIADWAAPGRWGAEFRTTKRRLIMQPMESLKVQELDSFAIEDVPLDDLDTRFKPGLYRQMEAFLLTKPEATALQSLGEHVRAVREDFLPLIGAAR